MRDYLTETEQHYAGRALQAEQQLAATKAEVERLLEKLAAAESKNNDLLAAMVKSLQIAEKHGVKDAGVWRDLVARKEAGR